MSFAGQETGALAGDGVAVAVGWCCGAVVSPGSCSEVGRVVDWVLKIEVLI